MQSIDYDAMTDELSHDEGGCRLTVYDDATGAPIRPGHTLLGHPTIGIGRALDVNGISATEGRSMAMNDIADYLLQLKPIPWFAGMDRVRQRAIINMRHQLGLDGLLAFRGMINFCELHDYASAAKAGLASEWARQTPTRAARVMEQLSSGVPPLLI